jgi:hypothetical protein
MPTAHSANGATRHVRVISPDPVNRAVGDFYRTPECGTRSLLKVEEFHGGIWEPACGDGAISEVLVAAGHEVLSTDLYDRGYGVPGVDFLSRRGVKWDNVVTNPPFTHVQEFVDKAREIATRKVAILGRLLWLEGERRYRSLFRYYPPCRVWVYTYRLNVSRYGADYGDCGRGGMVAFAWYIWDKADNSGKTQLGWLT